MVTEIRWSDNAIEDYQKIVEYLFTIWSEEMALRFEEMVENKIQQLIKHPHSGMRSVKNATIRSLLVTKYNRLYYRTLSDNVLEIVNILDMRQDPDKNPY